jgi:hypothetical protein
MEKIQMPTIFQPFGATRTAYQLYAFKNVTYVIYHADLLMQDYNIHRSMYLHENIGSL